MPTTVLLLEDEALIVLDLTMDLEAQGMRVVATPTIEGALAALDAGKVDVAIIDLVLNGELTTPVADALRSRDIPFVICSGGKRPPAPAFEGIRVFDKPYKTDDIYNAVRQLQRADV